MPSGANSACSASDRPSTANLVELYTPNPAAPRYPPIDETLRMRPERALRMYGSTARVTFSSPKTFVRYTASTSAALASSTAPIRPKPALFSNTSIRPKRAIAAAAASRDRTSNSLSGTGCLDLVGDIERDDEEVWMIAEAIGERLGCGPWPQRRRRG